MKTKILFIERKFREFVSIEKVFRVIAENLSKDRYEFSFQQMPHGNHFFDVIKNLIFFRKKQSDIYHVTGHIHYIALILPANRTILTIHDLGFLHTRKGLRRYVLKKILLDLPVKRLKFITAVSEATKKEIIDKTGCDEKKIHIIENPRQEIFLADEEKTFDKQNPTILQIGTSPNKNIENLIKALNGINCRLKIIGRLNNYLIELLRENKIQFENKFDLNDAEIKNEYFKADVVVFCSTYEGFGLPVIEAQAMKKPVVTSNVSPLKEVSGGAAFLANPDDYLNIREGILKIIKDENYRKKIIRAGLNNVERFKPGLIANLYENIYRDISSANK